MSREPFFDEFKVKGSIALVALRELSIGAALKAAVFRIGARV
jgi:hypothetical protein